MNRMNKPDALLLISTHCPHCHVMRDLLEQRLQEGRLEKLDVVNIEESPDVAQKYSVRTVPWFRLDRFEFDGVLAPAELDRWIDISSDAGKKTLYLEYLLANGKLSRAIDWLAQGHGNLRDLVQLIVKPDVKINVRIGVGAVLENFEGTFTIREVIPQLIDMAAHASPTVRADVCHYLMLTHSDSVVAILEKMLTDEDKHVREIARESIDDLSVSR